MTVRPMSLLTRLFKEQRPEGEKSGDSVWCVVANVVKERAVGQGGTEPRSGTKHFRLGTLVYCPTVLWGDGYENIKVVARHRGSHRYVTLVIRSSWLTNWRVKQVFSPHVIREFRAMGASWDGSAKSKRLAEQIVVFSDAQTPR